MNPSTTVTSVTLLMASSPVFGAVLGWLLLREPVGVATWVAVALAVLGGVVMVVLGWVMGWALRRRHRLLADG